MIICLPIKPGIFTMAPHHSLKKQKLTTYGPADLDHVEVSGKLYVAGPLQGGHLKVTELKVAS